MVTCKLLIMLEESLRDQEKKQGETERELEIVASVRKTGTVVLFLIVICQVVTSVVFCWRAR